MVVTTFDCKDPLMSRNARNNENGKFDEIWGRGSELDIIYRSMHKICKLMHLSLKILPDGINSHLLTDA